MTSAGDAYSARAAEYIEALGTMESVHPDDRDLVAEWSRALDGRVLDAGCGPGHWTRFLHGRGVAVEGIDLVPAFVESARSRFPDVPFRVGRLEAIDLPPGSVAGILSWYSIIHTPPGEIGQILDEFARCLRPGGTLLLGFFEGPAVEPFDHAVLTAYRWSFEALGDELRAAGFEVVETRERHDPGMRAHGAIIARRAGRTSRRSSLAPEPRSAQNSRDHSGEDRP